ncbi:uncharacterized protein METZ01_LOCUS22262 [marine metagenome]|uniref:Uncharacterized protein n=1 Tax=marine metagenome TaxID=408172 RepID=A0A381PSF5_9ZZZZ
MDLSEFAKVAGEHEFCPIYSQLRVVNTNHIKFALTGIAVGKE